MSTDPPIHEKFNLPRENFWVFGYGSLMWDPGFTYLESNQAKIYGYHRSLCIRSVRYRGTRELPGLVFGLDRGGSCTGMAYRIASRKQCEVADYLQDREMLNNIYDPCIRLVMLDDGRQVSALTFVVKRHHESYVRDLSPQQTASIVARAKGQRGANLDYVIATLNTLKAIGIRDRELDQVGQLAVENVHRTNPSAND